jgi:lysophospholipase L1-like esterase
LPTERSREGRWLALLAFWCVSLLGTLALVEAWLRLLGLFAPVSHHVAAPNQELRDVQTHWDLTYATNSLGLRGPEHAFARPSDAEGLIRIVTVGDSLAFGQGVELEEAFPEVLQRLLEAQGRRAEVINVSRIGSGPEDYFLMLRDIGLRYDPDLVVLNVFGNDASDASEPTWSRTVVRELSHHLHLFVVPRALNHRRAQRRNAEAVKDAESLWRLVAARCERHLSRAECERVVRGFRERWGSAVNNLAIAILTDPGEVRRWVYTDPNGPSWPGFRRYAAEMAGLCRRAGCRLVLGLIPDGVQVDPGQLAFRRTLGLDYPDSVLTETAPFQARVAELARELGVGLFDATETFRAEPEGLYYPSDMHLTAAGHRRYAQALLAYLEAEGYLDGR